ncbi:RNA polymerase sigma factor [Negadavirga shengliensis]|uniref:RNA polymerase sigma factor n=1 Tax=Negadavirga shengliensis TaxID=1389218 RepID=A0ABV9T6J1_9BACT
MISPQTSSVTELTAAWWQGLRKGDKASLEAIYRRFSDDMYRYGMALKYEHNVILDCIQEVFIDLWRYRENLSSNVNVRLYLFKSLTNKIYHFHQKEKQSRLAPLDESHITLFLVASHESELIEKQRNEDFVGQLQKALSGLPIRQKEVIQHIFFENHSYEETSFLMSVTVRTVYNLAWKAISNIKKSILL